MICLRFFEIEAAEKCRMEIFSDHPLIRLNTQSRAYCLYSTELWCSVFFLLFFVLRPHVFLALLELRGQVYTVCSCVLSSCPVYILIPILVMLNNATVVVFRLISHRVAHRPRLCLPTRFLEGRFSIYQC